MKVFIVNLEVKPEFIDEFIEVSKKNQEGSAKEAGNVRFDLLRDEANPNLFRLYEVWRDDEAIAAHREAPHYQAWAKAMEYCLSAPRSKSVSTPLALS